MVRVIVYIDGFNLYFGLKSKGWKRFYWLNLQKLAQNLLNENQELIITKYFTSRISSPSDKRKRQSTFIEALETLDNFEIFYGKYQDNQVECFKCGNTFLKSGEKMTDVNIATELLTDAFQNNFDRAILISADSDLVGPIKKVKQLFPSKQIVVAFPPNRKSKELASLTTNFIIGRRKLAQSLFPESIRKKDGFVLKKPKQWK